VVERLDRGEADVTVQDRLRLETFAGEVAARRSEAREAATTALFGLRALVGDDQVDVDTEPLAAFDWQSEAAEEYLVQAVTRQPELRAARAGVSALAALERLEQARWFPDLLATAGVNWARAAGVDNPPSAFANDPFNTTTAQAALVLRWTIEPAMQGPRVAGARAELERAKALEQAAERAGAFAIRQAQARTVEAKARLDAAAAGERSARGWVTSVLEADAVGTATARDIADAYLAYFTLRARVLQSIYDFDLAVVTLRSAAGRSALPPAPRRPEHAPP
jgi:outer membrane protein TolC